MSEDRGKPGPPRVPRSHLSLVLHAHLPFVRAPDDPAHLEGRWLEDALLECYLPLLDVLDGLAADGVPGSLSLGLTAPLVEMLRDPLLLARFSARLRRLAQLADDELARAPAELAPALRHHRARVDRVGRVLDRHAGDVVGGFLGHHRSGRLDLLAGAATHAFLPALPPRALDAQVHIGARVFNRLTGEAPVGAWLPECAVDGRVDAALGRAGIRFAVVEADALLGATPVPASGVRAPIASPHGVALFGRDPAASEAVWSAEVGYPGHPAYREWHRDVGFDRALPLLPALDRGPAGTRVATGLKLHRVTGRDVPLGDKAPWDPAAAEAQARAHARAFVDARADLAPGELCVAPFDAELFGHWWYEGPWFVDAVLRAAAEHPRLAAVSLRDHLRAYPRLLRAAPRPSTWGEAGRSATWIDEETAWILRHVRRGARALGDAIDARRAPDALLGLAVVEHLLLSASDWPFMIRKRTTAAYATRRVETHAERLGALLAMVEGSFDAARVAAIAREDTFLASLVDALPGLF